MAQIARSRKQPNRCGAESHQRIRRRTREKCRGARQSGEDGSARVREFHQSKCAGIGQANCGKPDKPSVGSRRTHRARGNSLASAAQISNERSCGRPKLWTKGSSLFPKHCTSIDRRTCHRSRIADCDSAGTQRLALDPTAQPSNEELSALYKSDEALAEQSMRRIDRASRAQLLELNQRP